MLVSLEDAKSYLRVDTSDDDDMIDILLNSARQLCADVARLSSSQVEEIENGSGAFLSGYIGDGANAKLESARRTMRISELYALGYLYEHREEADHHALALSLRDLLFAVREGAFEDEDCTFERKNNDPEKRGCCG